MKQISALIISGIIVASTASANGRHAASNTVTLKQNANQTALQEVANSYRVTGIFGRAQLRSDMIKAATSDSLSNEQSVKKTSRGTVPENLTKKTLRERNLFVRGGR